MPASLILTFVLKLSLCSAVYVLVYGALSHWKLAKEMRGLIPNIRLRASWSGS
jgi:hypothetical protein